MRTALHISQRTATLTREIARYKARIEAIGTASTRHEKRTLTMARKMLKRHEADLAGLGPQKRRTA